MMGEFVRIYCLWCCIFSLALLASFSASDTIQETIIYKDLEGHRCVLLQPYGIQPLGKGYSKSLKLIDDLTLEDIEVLRVQELNEKEVEDKWGREASIWCENLRKYTVVVDKTPPEKSDTKGTLRRSKRDTGYYQDQRRRNYDGHGSSRNFYQRLQGRLPYHRSPMSYMRNYLRRPNRNEYDSQKYSGRSHRNYNAFNKPSWYNSEMSQSSRELMQGDDAQASSNAFNNPPAEIDEKSSGMSTFSQVQVLKEGSQAEASSNGGMDGKNSDAQVSGSYSATGTFSAQAQSGFPKGKTKVQVQGAKDGSTAESTANIEQLGRSMSMSRLAPKGVAAANAEGTFSDGSTFVQSEGNREGGKSSARANSPGQTSSHAQVLMDGTTDDANSEDYVGMSSARSGGDLAGGHALSQVSGTYKAKNKYVAMASGGFGDHSEINSRSSSTGNEDPLSLPPASTTRQRLGRNGNQMYPVDGRSRRGNVPSDPSTLTRPGYGKIQPSRIGPESVRKIPSRNRYNKIDPSFSSRTGPLSGKDGTGGGPTDKDDGGYGLSRLKPQSVRKTSFDTRNGKNGFSSRSGPLDSNGNGADRYQSRRSNPYQTRSEYGNRNVGALTSPHSKQSKLGEGSCCNFQFICCTTCCKTDIQQNDSPRYHHSRRTSSQRSYGYGRSRSPKASEDAKRKISTLIKHTEELQNDQSVSRYGRNGAIRRSNVPNRYQYPHRFMANRSSYKYGRHSIFNSKPTPSYSNKLYNRPVARANSIDKDSQSTTGYQRSYQGNLYPKGYIGQKASNRRHITGLYAKPKKSSIMRTTSSRTRRIRPSARSGTAPSGNEFHKFSRYRIGNGKSTNSGTRSKSSNPCAVQFKCSYKMKSYGRVRHCKPFKPVGCS